MLILENKPKSVASEYYRILRTNLQYTSIDNPIKTILITSSEAGDGKSTTSSNLALSFADADKKTLLIDCDLRKPKIHKIFGISNLTGLSDFLIDEKKEVKNFIYEHQSGLNIMTSGSIPPNPAEILSSKRLETLLEDFKKIYDYIILDTPPVNFVADSKILSTKVDGTLIVIRHGKSKKDGVLEAIRNLKEVNANILGTVLNGESKKSAGYKSYYKEQK
ncbi:CpsD/CapB family tyrosine-protein kinase [Clostridium sp. B9]|uniref:CpsD/CapB family tyrosine-protein kinase n=1 Tax=Clostridium sp. B9 TaxID=3423224 RepID=UPI003D2EB7D3